MLERIEEILSRVDQFVDTSESVIVGLVAKIAPWATPIPTAFLVYDRTITHLGWPKSIAFISAIAIETLGLATTFWVRNRIEAEAKSKESTEAFNEYLKNHVTHPGNVLAILRRQA